MCITWSTVHLPRRAERALARTLLASLVVVAVAVGSSSAALASSETWVTTPITSNDYDDSSPQVSGDRVVWVGNGGSDGGPDTEIFTWTPNGGTVQITSNGYADEKPQVSGSRVVWQGSDGSDLEVFTWTPNGGTVQITSNGYADEKPQVSGSRVVWQGSEGSDLEVFTWTPNGGTVQITSNGSEDSDPQVSGDRVVWVQAARIFTWTPTGGTIQISSNDHEASHPQLSGDRVAWDAVAVNIDYGKIVTWTPDRGMFPVEHGGITDECCPRISGERIVWEGYDGNMQVFTWSSADGSVDCLADTYWGASGPQVSGDRVVWSEYDDPHSLEVFTWTPGGGEVQLTSDDHTDGSPQVSGNRVVWESDDGSDNEIFTAVLSSSYLTIRGTDRMDTAVKISRAAFPAGMSAGSGLVLAPAESFQEALCAAPLAAAAGGPVLLTYKAGLNNGVRDEMLRLAPAVVYGVGLPDLVLNQVRNAMGDGVSIRSITGANVYQMSRNVAASLEIEVYESGGDISAATAIITIGTNFPDAIGVAPLACARLWPIILTDKAGGTPAPALHAEASAALSDLGIKKAIKVGTYAALPSGVTGLVNLSGSDRYYTNQRVANWAQTSAGLAFFHTALATGDKFPDALASGPYLARDDGILLLSPLYGPLPNPISTLLSESGTQVQRLTFIACIEPVIGQVKALLP